MKPLIGVTLVAGLLAGGVVLAASLPKLPRDLALPQTGDSPGPVSFSHRAHVDSARPDCTACHPRPFPMLAKARSDSGIRHQRMDAGQQCGTCHGKTAFGLEDCAACHREQ